ncbi:MAG: hypothetical protein WC670_12200 [Pseudolabrys sp.]|jgi:hypothetical protein
MNDKRPTPDNSAGRRKRAAPTIDLEAKELPADNTQAEPVTEAGAATESGTATPETSEAPIEGLETPQSASTGDTVTAPERGGGKFAAIVGAGVAGAALMTAIVAAAWYGGVVPGNEATAPDPRIAALEAQVKQLGSPPAATTGDTTKADSLIPRVAKLEDRVAKLPTSEMANDTALNERIAASDNAMKSLGVALTALNRRYDELAANTKDAQARADAAAKAAADLRSNLQDVSKTAQAGASSADLASLQQRITALEAQAKSAQAELAKATRSDNAARLALSAAALRDAVLRGAPFADELAQAKSLGADDKALAPLAPFATSGVPGNQALAKELRDLLPQLQKAVGTPAPSGSFIERLQANAEHLVRVRPAGAPAGDDAAAVLARLEVEAAAGDIAAALADAGKLPEAARQLTSDWVTRAIARQKALAAARDFAAGSARSLGSR